ncbi:hypothetical protein N7517_001896 [Penicillium concentricum]|uniref:Uncharacterized protein n=1 Tax=Penicillium concentricum TaxID=293559 RepID=A0A9W9STR0_9EURO|nr:uncharacterized protein N7517_001896 [Penicillium concentricum]KAJ5383985.1 hypothetical protein N7517_001896 [Penicillium concentricum]
MAATHGPATHLPAGPMAISAPTPDDEVREYEKILAINDQVFSGTHPRLNVPQHLVRKSGRNVQNVPLRTHLPKNPPPKAVSANAPVAAAAKQPYNSSQNALARNALPAAPQPARVASKPTSEIDPIFLTKSDDLIRAELQLQRQRLERALRDQVELKKQETKQRPAVQDTKPDFDVSEVFKQALEAVKPVSLSDVSEASGSGGAASDSFDDNSFYSSRAPDSPPQTGGQQKSSPVAILAPTGPTTRVPVTHYADELQRLEALNPPGSDQEMPDAYLVADQRHSHSQKQGRYHKAEAPVSRFRDSHQFETVDEPEYSPPAPAAPPADHREYPRGVESDAGRKSRPDARYTDRTQDIRKPPSPASVKVVRNHITSPAAPRPSRVSPLATAKVPSVQQIRDERSEQGPDQVYLEPDSARGSPSSPVFQVMSRKRRRLREGDEGPRPISHRIQNAEPVEAFIKEEPVSPPPFADDHPVVRGRNPAERPIYIDIASPQYTPVYESRGPPVREPIYEIDPYHGSQPEAGPQRTISRLSIRRPVREEADLRRVASSQYARQSDYAREYIEAQPRPVRAASYVVERPVHERPRYYEEAPPYAQHRYIAADDMPPPTYRETYYEEAPPARMMAPPQRRIVVDEHGTQYYELLQAPRLQPMAPPPPPPPRPVSQMPKDVYDERVHHHAGSVRAPSVVQDPYGERHYVQEMPPPQPVYRRVTSEYARPLVAHERQGYAAPLEGHEPYSRSNSVQVAEYLPRHAVYVDERGVPQERIIRTASVRPPQPRYEDSHEVVQRVGSVRPTGPGREPSIFMEDRQVGEYVERPYYIRDRRYYEGEGEEGDRIALDGANDTIQRGPQRY